ncbi:MAG: IS66 family insertion sequence element accessory protein TnpB [Myxococcales bacterium]|nr:IS66 family insertion sequence element accessory protein TnpB [Myxococcales bacterium]
MIPHGVEIYVGLDPIDLRWGFDRLRGVVGERVGRDARGGSLFVFFGRRRDALKVLFFDGTGMCVFYKRLDRGTFRIPTPAIAGAACVALTDRELDDLLDGIEVEAEAETTKGKRSRIH